MLKRCSTQGSALRRLAAAVTPLPTPEDTMLKAQQLLSVPSGLRDSWIDSLEADTTDSGAAEIHSEVMTILGTVPTSIYFERSTPAPTRFTIPHDVDSETSKVIQQIWKPHKASLVTEAIEEMSGKGVAKLTKRKSREILQAFMSAISEKRAGAETLSTVLQFFVVTRRSRIAYRIATDIGSPASSIRWSFAVYADIIAVLSLLEDYPAIRKLYMNMTSRPRIVCIAYFQALLSAAPSRMNLATLESAYLKEHCSAPGRMTVKDVLGLAFHVADRNGTLCGDAAPYVMCLRVCSTKEDCMIVIAKLLDKGMLFGKEKAGGSRSARERQKRVMADPSFLISTLIEKAAKADDIVWLADLAEHGLAVQTTSGVKRLSTPTTTAMFKTMLHCYGRNGSYEEAKAIYKRARSLAVKAVDHAVLDAAFITACAHASEQTEEAFELAMYCFLSATWQAASLRVATQSMVKLCLSHNDPSSLSKIFDHASVYGLTFSPTEPWIQGALKVYTERGITPPSMLITHSAARTWNILPDY